MTDALELTVTHMGAQGDGIAEHDGASIFIPGAAPGDKVAVTPRETRKNGIHAVLDKILEAGDGRAEPACKHFGSCGGCSLQYVADGAYAKWLKDRTAMALAHHGFDGSVIADPVISPPGSRRRVALKALKIASGIVLGFAEAKSHQIIDIAACPVTRPELVMVFTPLKKLLAGILPQKTRADVHLTLTATGVDMLIDAPIELGLDEREALVSFAEAHDVAAVHWRDEGFLDPVAIRREPVMAFAGVHVPLAPASFIQATAEGEDALVKEVLAATKGLKRVADLFSGMGTFTLPLARQHQVLAVEGAKSALDALQIGVNGAVGLKQVVTAHRDLFRRPLTAKELKTFDGVVFDPPRAGAKEQVIEIAQSDVQTVVAVSCNPNTFSRDVRVLAEGGYTLERVVPVDQFLWSPHLELVGVLRKA